MIKKIEICKLDLDQMVRFLVLESTHPGSNLIFDVIIMYLQLIILSVVNDVPIDNEMFFDWLYEF
jgi:hypothetical protein